MGKVHVLMATIPERKDTVLKAVNSLYNQVDELRVIFNNYSTISDWTGKESKIVPFLNTSDKYTSNAVWLMMKDIEGFIFVCDDDILYPQDYVSRMIEKVEKYERKVVITSHGSILKMPFRDYISDRKVFHFKNFQQQDEKVDIGGVGCLVFHTDAIRPRIVDFPDKFSRDIWFAILAAKNSVPIVCIERKSRWIRSLDTLGVNIYSKVCKDPELRRNKNKTVKEILLPLLSR